MKNEDAQLVNHFLSGDENAFTTLIKKYEKSVHALAWRKVGDFHIAEELTQDAFLKVYQKLATLKNPNQFAGWLYVITDRLCIDWHRKQKPSMESLETISGAEIEESSYRHYEDEQRKEASTEYRRRRIKSLLEKLPESERTVATLYYLGEMTSKAISEFLGVSPNTIRSRLQRARNRLKEQEDMIRETLGSIQLPANFTENIMQQVAEIKPIVPTSIKPIVPWAVSAATAILIFLIVGIGSQHLTRFQRPYNINAQSETTVEIVDAPIVLDTQAKRNLRNQAGRFDNIGRSKSVGPQVSESLMLAAAQVEKETLPSTKQQWVQVSGPAKGRSVSNILASSWGDVYAVSRIGIYKLVPDAFAWTLVSPLPREASTDNHRIQVAERNDTLYLVFPNGVFASKDRGETWIKLGERPQGVAIGLVVTDDALYLAVRDKGIFLSTDAGKQWVQLNNEIVDGGILSVAAIENTVFVGTNKGLYRLHSGAWEKLQIDTTKAIHSLSVSENNLYVGTGRDPSQLETAEGREAYMAELMERLKENNSASLWEIFRSTDLGNSWTEITPTSNSHMMKIATDVKVLAFGKRIMALGMVSFRSTDLGNTWTELSRDAMMTSSSSPAVAVDENTFFRVGSELTRSTDGGESWHPFIKGIVGTSIFNLVGFKNELYTITTKGVSKSSNGGESWKDIPMDSGELTLKPVEKERSTYPSIFPQLAIVDGVLYGITSDSITGNTFRIYRLSTNGNVLVPIQGVPAVGEDPSITDTKAWGNIIGQLERPLSAFAVSSETFYIEQNRQLLRWKRGGSEWFNTRLVDTGETSKARASAMRGFELAVSDETVYVGKRDGHLFQSLDGGNTWNDLTTNLPLRFERFNDITFAGSTVYVATDAGVLTSEAGERWHIITDTEGTRTIINQIAVDNRVVYGASDEAVYRLNNRDAWEKITPEVPDSVTDLVVNNDRLYIITEHRGMFHISVEKGE